MSKTFKRKKGDHYLASIFVEGHRQIIWCEQHIDDGGKYLLAGDLIKTFPRIFMLDVDLPEKLKFLIKSNSIVIIPKVMLDTSDPAKTIMKYKGKDIGYIKYENVNKDVFNEEANIKVMIDWYKSIGYMIQISSFLKKKHEELAFSLSKNDDGLGISNIWFMTNVKDKLFSKPCFTTKQFHQLDIVCDAYAFVDILKKYL